MDIRLLSQRIEQKFSAFSRKMGLPTDIRPAAGAGGVPHAEINELKQELEHMTELYKESLCVWEHEMEVLKSRLAETGYHIRELEKLRGVNATAEQEAAVKNQEITRLFGRVDELKKENAILESDTRILSSQLRKAWQTKPINGVRRHRHGPGSRIIKWLFHPMITARGESHE
jgi:3-hydroxyacyl-CoA dehydrogenase